MFRVLIADDEPLVRAGICGAINWEALGIEIVAQADNGQKALELIRIHHPHILLLDLHMPEKDGLEVLRTIRQEKDPVRVIVISNTWDYAVVHTALKLGAEDYLLKASFQAEELQETLVQLCHEIEMCGIGDRPNRISWEETARDFRRLLREEPDKDFLQQMETRYPTSGYTMCCFAIPKRSAPLIDKVHRLFLQERKNFSPICSFLCRENQILSIISHTQNPIWIDNYVNVMISAVRSYLNLPCFASISRPETEYVRFPVVYKEMQLANEEWFYMMPPKIIHCTEGGTPFLQREKADELTQLLDVLKTEIEYYDLSQLQDTTRALFSYLKLHHNVLPKIVKNDLINVVNQCTNILRRMELSGTDIDKLFAYTDITEKSDVFELENWMLEFMDKYCQLVIRGGDDMVHNAAILRAANYIQQHYAQRLRLSDIATQANLSSNYFSTLFKRVMGTGVVEYLNLKRIEAAKELLAQEMDCRVSEVAYQVGFDSIPYFSKIFRQTVGITAAEYRKRQFVKNVKSVTIS